MKIHAKGFHGGKYQAYLCAGLVAGAAAFVPGHILAQNITLNDGGSTAIINPGSGTGALGMNTWSVNTDAQNQLEQQWFWYSIDGQTVQAINSISTKPTVSLNQADNDLTLTYANSQIAISIEYTLLGSGSGSGSADISEGINIFNLSGSTLTDVALFQYSHFNLLQSGNNSVYIASDPQTGVGFVSAEQTSGSSAIAEGIISPDANAAEAGQASQTYSDVLAGTLNDNQVWGAGDAAWAFEWQTNIVAGGDFSIQKDKSLSIQMVPEPSTMALVAMGLGALGLLRRRQ